MYNCENIIPDLLNCVVFAAEAHKHQKRKADGSSYICHPLRVAKILIDSGFSDIHLLRAAVLHDTLEDTNTTVAELHRRFGPQVTGYVQECTTDKSLSKVEQKKQQVEKMKTISEPAYFIKIADAIDNLSDLANNPPPDWTEARIRGYFIWKGKCLTKRFNDFDLYASKLFETFWDVFREGFKLDGKHYDIFNLGGDWREEDPEQMLQDYYDLVAKL